MQLGTYHALQESLVHYLKEILEPVSNMLALTRMQETLYSAVQPVT